MPSKKFSELWNHFSEVDENIVKCNYCSQILKFVNRSTYNLIRHMKTKHVTISIYRSSTKIGNTISNTSVISNDSTISTSIIAVTENTENVNNVQTTPDPAITINKQVKHNKQQQITNYVHKPVSLKKSKELDQQLVKMIVKEYHPLRVVEDPEFRKFINMLCPGYKLPSRKTISYSLIPQLFNSTEEILKEKINCATAVCITTDGWTSINNESFTSITAHFIDNDTNLNSNLLCCISYNDKHTAENLCQFLKEKINEWNLTNKVTAVVSDNAANITAAIRLGQWRHLPCFAHNLNLIVQTSLKNNSTKIIIDKVKAIVQYFKRSSTALAKLHSVQEGIGLAKLKLKQDTVTRWNSTYDMLIRILETKDAVVSALVILNNELNSISAHEWVVLQQISEILKIFYAITNEVSAEKTVTVSTLLIFTNVLKKNIESYFENERPFTPTAEIEQLLVILKDQTNKRLQYVEENEICTQATLLDPRYKKFGFPNEEKYNKAYSSLVRKASTVEIPVETTTSTVLQGDVTSNAQASSSQSAFDSMLWQDFDKQVFNSKTAINPTSAGIIEVDNFLKEPVIGRKENPLKWWKNKKEQYPRLYELAIRRLCIVGTSVPCERVFSKMGQIINERRTRLTSKRVSQIIFLNGNLN